MFTISGCFGRKCRRKIDFRRLLIVDMTLLQGINENTKKKSIKYLLLFYLFKNRKGIFDL